MNKSLFLAAFLSFAASTMNQAAPNISRIEPANWFAGMSDPSLQLMVYGQDISSADVSIDYPGASIDSIVRLQSPNYLLVYLNLSEAKPGTATLTFSQGKKQKKVEYIIKEREKEGSERMGFSNADVLYMLMPDRFARAGDSENAIEGLNEYTIDRSEPSLRHGGNLEGIRQHLDYFCQLGVTALWFTPVLENNSPDDNIHKQSTYHGYATTDYYRVDPRFGSNDDYRRLIDEAHSKGLKVVMDMIFNHCGFDHPWVSDIPSASWFNTPEWLDELNQSGKSLQDFDFASSSYLQTSYKLTPVIDPYASKVDLMETTDGWFVPSMPDLNQRNPHVIKYLIQNSIWWIETADIDGIRMDTYPYADREAMALWMRTLENEYPNFNTVGETWVTEPAYTASWQKGSLISSSDSYLKTVMDFSFYDRINKVREEETDDWWNGLNRIYNLLVYDFLYPNPSSVMAFIDNHDTDRFLGDGKDTLALKQALALLLTINRIPQIYYGTEILMNGTKTVTDGNVRKDFPGGFPGDNRDAFTANGRTKAENSMFNWLSRLLHWRQGNEVITKGTQTQFIPYKGIYVIARQYEGKSVVTIINGRKEENSMDLGRYREILGPAEQGRTAKDILSRHQVSLSDSTLTLKPRQTLILEF